jgi:hypothetical protein
MALKSAPVALEPKTKFKPEFVLDLGTTMTLSSFFAWAFVRNLHFGI